MGLNGKVENPQCLRYLSLGLRLKRLVAVAHARLSVVVVLALGLVPPPRHPTTYRPRPHPRLVPSWAPILPPTATTNITVLTSSFLHRGGSGRHGEEEDRS